MSEQLELTATDADLIALANSILQEPVAQERLKAIILRRMYEESQAELAKLRNGHEPVEALAEGV